ncbi:hypothetical protein DFJ73DRAFT_773489 [Zopfochytrium polystomum]|nr:hypothetical protein DFJ73DRAFT_773489 [Zopfochytrium polystomum]
MDRLPSSAPRNSHKAVVLYDSKTVFLFSFLQVMIASSLAAVCAIWTDDQTLGLF